MGSGTGPGRILEHEGAVEPYGPHHLARRLEFFFGLSAEAHDDVRRQGDAGHALTEPADHVQEHLRGVVPAHAGQGLRRAGLQRKVRMGTDLGGSRHGLDQPVREMGRVGRGKPNAIDAVDFRRPGKQVREVDPAVPVLVDRLPEHGHFPVSFRREAFDLADHFAMRRAALPAAHEGDDAEAAHLVAAAHDRDPAVDAGLPHGIDVEVMFRPVPGQAQRRFAFRVQGAEHGRQAPVAVGTRDQVDIGRPFDDPVAEVLGHASA